jgi:hypothetical protein
VITEPGDYRGPWTLTLDSAEIFLLDMESFRFDPGADPQIRQLWLLDEYLTIGGYAVQPVSMQWLPRSIGFDERQDDFELRFEFQAADPVWRITLADAVAHAQGSGIRTDGRITASIYY